jgi:uncharacterized protein YecE (DUF72 family)
MSQKAKKGVIFFNNHVRAQAPDNAKEMIRLLKGHDLKTVHPKVA